MTALNLKNLQIEFKKYLFTGANEDALVPMVKETNNIGSLERLHVYFNAYYLRLEESLENDFPALLAVLGEEEFGQLAVSYLRDYPSEAPSLRYLGRKLAEWLLTQKKSELADVVFLEWAVLNAFDALESESISKDSLAAIQPEQWPGMFFSFHPSVSLLEVTSNTFAIWAAVRQEKTLPLLKKLENPEYLAVWRAGVNPTVAVMADAEYKILLTFKDGSTFAETCSFLAEHINELEVPKIAAQTLAKALQFGWITKISFIE